MVHHSLLLKPRRQFTGWWDNAVTQLISAWGLFFCGEKWGCSVVKPNFEVSKTLVFLRSCVTIWWQTPSQPPITNTGLIVSWDGFWRETWTSRRPTTQKYALVYRRCVNSINNDRTSDRRARHQNSHECEIRGRDATPVQIPGLFTYTPIR